MTAPAVPSRPIIHPPTGRLQAWLKPTWIEKNRGLVEPSGIHPQSVTSNAFVERVDLLPLTESALAHYLLVIEWLAGSPLLPREIVAIRTAIVDGFRRAPEPTLARMAKASSILAAVPLLAPASRAALRQQLRAAVARRRDDDDADPVAGCLDHHDPVQIVTGRGVVVTTESCAAWRWRREMVAHVAGVPLEQPTAENTAPLPAGFDRWSRARQLDLAYSAVHFVAGRSVLRGLDLEQLREVARVLHRLVNGPRSVEAATAALTTVRPGTDVAETIRSCVVGQQSAPQV